MTQRENRNESLLNSTDKRPKMLKTQAITVSPVHSEHLAEDYEREAKRNIDKYEEDTRMDRD